ncbi:MAG: YdiU family protein [Saprospiraceae bacterium]|nr:YdiU family protein [Saprospiraceae bacterium]MCB9322296.1 YdiU family protein [Lewinellaceae bacterium]
MNLNIKDTFNKELPADPNLSNSRRQVFEACYSYVTPRIPSQPVLVHAADDMVEAIGLSKGAEKTLDFLQVFSGAKVLEGTEPYAMCYGGHQFGNWAGQLGDGRAINLAEVVHENKRWALQLKGAGETPYSRTADGLAVLRSSIREHLCSEAMFHLGVPTTRSLSLILTGDQVMRDMLYDGNPAYEKGAVVCRVAPSFIRFGNFQIFSARKDLATLRQLADYTIRHFFPKIEAGTKNGYIQFFREVAQRTLDMVIEWQRIGFVHGVMNTDNFSILGLTIDYGPYGWLEGYDPNWTPNTTDKDQRRYRFGNQPGIAFWNLVQLGNALYPLVEEAEPFEEILEQFKSDFAVKYPAMMRSKLGLQSEKEGDHELIAALEKQLQATETDMTIFFRLLSKVKKGQEVGHPSDFLTLVKDAFYTPEELKDEVEKSWGEWFEKYVARLGLEVDSDEAREIKMNEVNPKYVLRNYMAQLAIDKADEGDFSLIDELYELLKNPYSEQSENQKWFTKRPEWAREKVGCSMLSCSS